MRLSRLQLPIFLSFALIFTLPSMADAKITFKPGVDLRLRHEYLKNVFDFNTAAKDNQNYFRIKYSLSGTLGLNDKTSVYLKLTDEMKIYTYLYTASTGKKGARGDINETVWDNFYLDFKDVLQAPVDIRLGRQDFLGTYGEGFLIMDGTPLDGSRTYYFNAAKTSWKVNGNNRLDAIYINDPKRDTFLPIINENDPSRALNISDEEGYVLDWQNKDWKNLTFEGYYIYKTEGKGGTRLQAQKGRINTPGFFSKYDFDPYTIRGQFALQTGSYGLNDRQAQGGYVFLDRNFSKVKWTPKASLGFLYLSGDNPTTGTNEGWDPLFSRYPWMSELYCLSYNGESGMGYWTNLQMWRTELNFKITDKAKLTFWYNFLRANEIPAGTSFAIGDGYNRGQLPQGRIDYAFSKNVTAYFLAEYFVPGNFYSDGADPALFLRTELRIKF